MDVSIKKFDVKMNVKNKGMELEVVDPKVGHLGDLVVNRTKLIWCKGRTTPAKGKKVLWKDFIAYMESL
jgi:hypothetical protein